MPVGALINVILLVLAFGATSAAAAKVIKSRSVEGISMTTMTLSLYSCATWWSYALLTHNTTQIATTSFGMLGLLVALVVAHRTDALNGAKVAGGLLVYGAGAFALLHVVGIAGLGMAVSVLTFFVRAPQVLLAIRRPGGAGVSVASQGMDATQSILWTVTGIARGDIFLAGSSAYCMATSAYVATRTSRARRTGRVIGRIETAARTTEITRPHSVAA